MHKSKHIALVVYYWPPSGGSGVQRWLFFANAWAKSGMQLTVFVPLRPRVSEVDETLLEKLDSRINIIAVKGWEPLSKSKSPIAENIGINKGFKNQFFRWIRANFFIPDARVFWAKAACKRLTNQHGLTPFDVVITSGPPHSIHKVGLETKNKLGVSWIADFRDPWTGFFQNNSLPMLKPIKLTHQKQERNVVTQADAVVVTAPSLASAFYRYNTNTYCMTNGFERILQQTTAAPHGLVYAGSLKAQQNSKALWSAIAELLQENDTFRAEFSLELYGQLSKAVKEHIHAFGIETHVKHMGYQSKSEIDKRLPNAKALLLLGINMPNTENVIHGKLFEYMATQRPILAIGPRPSDMEQLFTAHKLGIYATFDEKAIIKNTLLQWFSDKELLSEKANIDQFKRANIAKDYLNLILSIS